jgi:hypothetical protein
MRMISLISAGRLRLHKTPQSFAALEPGRAIFARGRGRTASQRCACWSTADWPQRQIPKSYRCMIFRRRIRSTALAILQFAVDQRGARQGQRAVRVHSGSPRARARNGNGLSNYSCCTDLVVRDKLRRKWRSSSRSRGKSSPACWSTSATATTTTMGRSRRTQSRSPTSRHRPLQMPISRALLSRAFRWFPAQTQRLCLP